MEEIKQAKKYAKRFLTSLLIVCSFTSTASFARYDYDDGYDNHYTYSRNDDYSNNNFDATKIPDAVPHKEALNPGANPSSYEVGGQTYHVMKSAKGYDKVGYATWYGSELHGQPTTSDEPFDMYKMTAASPCLPIPTYIRVTNLKNKRSVIVRVNDRGPFGSKSKILDLSYAAAKKLGFAGAGIALVRVTAIDPDVYLAENKNSSLSSPKTQLAENTTTTATENSSKTIQLASNSRPVYLQIGAFKKRDSAEHLVKQIASLTQSKVAIKPTQTHGNTIYRVHIGPLLGMQYAEVKQQLIKYGYPKPMVVSG